jgi:hypothetical protein
MCLTAVRKRRRYSFTHHLQTSKLRGMSNQSLNNEPRLEALKNQATRQRWDLFHRAISYAKQSNADAMREAEAERQPAAPEPVAGRAEPQLSLAR